MDVPRSRKKSEAKAAKEAAKAVAAALKVSSVDGYETDATSKSTKGRTKLRKKKTVTDSGGYETDDGYTSSSGKSRQKSRFFRLKSRNREPEPMPEPLPQPLPVFRLPIAERFARTLGDVNAQATTDPPLLVPAVSTSGSNLTSVDTFGLFAKDSDGDRFNISESFASPFAQYKPTGAPSSSSSDYHDSSTTSHNQSILSRVTNGSPTVSTKSYNVRQTPTISYPLTRSPSPQSKVLGQNFKFPAEQRSAGSPEPLAISIPSPFNGTIQATVVDTNISSSPQNKQSSPRGRRFFTRNSIDINNPPRLAPGPEATPTNSDTDVSPSSAFIVSSRGNSPSPLQPPPSYILSQHELPPPSPPPALPLPELPLNATSGPFSHQQLRPPPSSPAVSRSVSPSPRRGRESPFPSRPIQNVAPVGTRNDFESRVNVPRYRDLYALPVRSALTNQSDEWEYGSEANSKDVDELRDVISRFQTRKDASPSANVLEHSPALGRSRSFEAMRDQYLDAASEDSDDASEYPDDDLGTGRNTLFVYNQQNGSVSDVESRSSMMDPTKSEQARVRFLKRIEVMFDQNGRELNDSTIPPVPSLPRGIAGAPVKLDGWF